MKTSIIVMLSFLCFSINSQEKFTISGYVSDGSNGENLIGASIYNIESMDGTSTNLYGFYSLTLAPDTYKIAFSYVGYNKKVMKVVLNKDIDLTISLENNIELKTVEIVAERLEKGFESSQMSVTEIPMQQVEKLPTFMGERDLVKIAQMLPGVQNTEGSSGMYVRGGGPDQNLILLDGVPVYNASHLFGFFSVFNSDAISHLELVKGGFPARYGGRISSVLDIRMKEGNKKEIHGSGSIGLIASKLTLEGPIKNENTSFMISGRRTYIDILAAPFIRASNDEDYSQSGGYYFYDFNAKINHTFSKKDRLYLSAYTGKDKGYFNLDENFENTDYIDNTRNDASLKWGNLTTALRWNHMFSNKLFSNITTTYSRYNFQIANETENYFKNKLSNTDSEEIFTIAYNSGIYDLGLKWDFDYIPSTNQYIKFGLGMVSHTFTPGVTSSKATSDAFDITEEFGFQTEAKPVNANEMTLFIEDDIKLSSSVKANIGFHLSSFFVEGSSYINPQGRFSIRKTLGKNFSIKASYSNMVQYIHLLTNGGIGLPTDLWVPVTDTIKPITGTQYAIGIAKSLSKSMELSVEAYYKDMNNIIEYKDGTSFILNATDWQDKVESGSSNAYGVEVFLQKKLGKTSGWLGYTLSWVNRKFENINFGESFPYKFDRRHDISLAVVHDFSDKFNMGLTWQYGSGNAVSLPVASYPSYQPLSNELAYNSPIEHYTSRNGFRMPAYHRMDISFNWIKQKKRGERTWNLSIYNLYNRQNPFVLYFRQRDFSDERHLEQVSLFPFIPSFSYNFKF